MFKLLSYTCEVQMILRKVITQIKDYGDREATVMSIILKIRVLAQRADVVYTLHYVCYINVQFHHFRRTCVPLYRRTSDATWQASQTYVVRLQVTKNKDAGALFMYGMDGLMNIEEALFVEFSHFATRKRARYSTARPAKTEYMARCWVSKFLACEKTSSVYAPGELFTGMSPDKSTLGARNAT